MGYGFKMIFTKASDEVEALEDFNRSRTDKMQVSFNYEKLNESYDTKEISISDDYFHSYSKEELNAKPIVNKIYVPNSLLEKKILELQKDLQNEKKLFDDERN